MVETALDAKDVLNATVSIPLLWSEVKSGLKITDFTIKTVPKIMAKRKYVFKAVLGKGIDMDKAIEDLNS